MSQVGYIVLLHFASAPFGRIRHAFLWTTDIRQAMAMRNRLHSISVPVRHAAFKRIRTDVGWAKKHVPRRWAGRMLDQLQRQGAGRICRQCAAERERVRLQAEDANLVQLLKQSIAALHQAPGTGKGKGAGAEVGAGATSPAPSRRRPWPRSA